MRIAVETDNIINLLEEEQHFCCELLCRLPRFLPEEELIYHNDDLYDFGAEGVRLIYQFDKVAADLALNFSACGHFSGTPTVSVFFYLPPEKDGGWLSWLTHKISRYSAWSYDPAIKTLLVSHEQMRSALIEQYPELTGKVRVVGSALPTPYTRFAPADSVTRRITKEVYGQEKSFFLAPTSGEKTDNIERVVRAYDLFRQRCPEDVKLIIGGAKNKQPRSVRTAIKAATHRADISFLPVLSEAEYWKVYSAARAILYPSLSARFPTEILKAWHAEVPVLAGDNEVLGGAGAQVRCEDHKSIAEGMVALVTTPFLASGLVESGKRRLTEFTWERVTQRVAEILRATSHSAPA